LQILDKRASGIVSLVVEKERSANTVFLGVVEMSYTLILQISHEELAALLNEETLTVKERKALRRKVFTDLLMCARQERADLEAIDEMVIKGRRPYALGFESTHLHDN
jgi:hypothetical protein